MHHVIYFELAIWLVLIYFVICEPARKTGPAKHAELLKLGEQILDTFPDRNLGNVRTIAETLGRTDREIERALQLTLDRVHPIKNPYGSIVWGRK